MPSRPWYKWFPGDYRADTMHLTLVQDALYRRILDELWLHGPMPNDVAYIAKRIGVEKRVLQRAWPVLERFMNGLSPLLDHPKIAAQRAEWQRKGQKKRQSYPQARGTPDPDHIYKNRYPDAGARARESHDATDATPVWQLSDSVLLTMAANLGVATKGKDRQSLIRDIQAKQREAH